MNGEGHHPRQTRRVCRRSFAVVELPRLRLSGFLAWVTWLFVHITYLIGFRNRLLVLLEWAWAYVTFQRSARIISRDVTSSTSHPPGGT